MVKMTNRNRLSDETSPYLLQHRDNPVHWQAWGPNALEQSRNEGKPILLSVGYAACHWCHVMAHESFENEEIAGLMNEQFVNIKVDREERPDLDAIYQAALALLGQQGGWPLTMFLTPDGHPFWGGTYFPPEQRWGRPGFRQVLQGIAETYRNDPDRVQKNVSALKEALGQLAQPAAGTSVGRDVLDRIAERLLQEVDQRHGGIGGAPKFPQASIFELLWRAWKRTGNARYRDAVYLTLTRMSQGGIYDHLGGGFARYATDAEWLVPHFEKMLYDNAALIDLLALAWQESKEPLFEQRIRETVGWTLREMLAERVGDGSQGFASALDADSEGVEGKFYVWSEAEIDEVLGDEAALFKQHYDVGPEGNWEGHTILNRSARPLLADAATESRLADARAKLLQRRDGRIRPGWDDKVLADWNGLMIAALANAGALFAEPGWIDAARSAFAFVRDHMTIDGRLRHSWRAGRARHPATLDDYAQMARAALALAQATGEKRYIADAEGWLAVLDTHYWDKAGGGYFFSADDTSDVILRNKSAIDHATPSGNATVIGVLARLFYLTDNTAYRDRADAIVGAFAGEIGRNFFPLASFINANEFLQNALQIVIVGDRDAADTQAMLSALRTQSLPDLVLTRIAPGEELPDAHPAKGKGQSQGRATVYICRGMTCSLPIVDPAGLGKVLAHA
ncbi:MAG: uncharacterized protein QOK29_4625 [Rhodospirillaceae bacterium]|nr:uncharacterized protein [Rhodospirillaceae bacterium]